MKIAVIGGGFTGLTAAYELAKSGYQVTIFEKDNQLGGLAVGWKEPNWQWSLERAYHHWFTNDAAAYQLMQELGIENHLIVRRPITATLYKNKMYPLDSISALLKFPGLNFIERVRTGTMLAFFKLNPFWQPLEHITAVYLIKLLGGQSGWRTIWEPLLKGKFGHCADRIAASWFWARIQKRTASLAYPAGGFHYVIDTLATAIRKHGGKIHLNFKLDKLNQLDKFDQFDKILLTIPTPLITKIIPGLTAELKPSLTIPHLHAQVLILETAEPILKDVYWLNVTDQSFPFLAVVSHTNYIDKRYYGGRHITYIGNYLPPDHPYLKFTKAQLLKKFLPYLKKLNPQLQTPNSKLQTHIFTAPFAQPVHELHYSSRAPKLETPNPNIFIANMDSIYPWDRGTNYAVELGQKAAEAIKKSYPAGGR